MMRLLFTNLLILLTSQYVFSQAVIPFEKLHPQLENKVNDIYLNLQWGHMNYGQIVQQQRSELEYEPICGNNFELTQFDPESLSAEDFFLGSSGKVCVPKSSTSGESKDYDVSWMNYILNYESLINRDVVVAVVDSGLDYDHPDIIENIARDDERCNIAGKPGEIQRPKKPKRDRNRNRVDNGERTQPRKEESKVVPTISEYDFSADCMGWDFTYIEHKLGNNDVRDDSSFSHGTHLAGILSAGVSNGIGISGLSNRIKVLPVKVFREFKRGEAQRFSIESEFKFLLDQVAAGLEYLALVKRNGRHVDAVNLSFGWPKRLTTERLNKAIQALIDLDIVVVAAAGNDDVTVDLFPCAYPGVICVGAHTNNGTIASFSNYGSTVDMLAAGDNILSLHRTDEVSFLFSQSDDYDFQSGTSQAAPFVAGAAAILKGIYNDISLDEVKARLFASSLIEKKADHKFALNGILQLSESVTQVERPYIYPDFKKLMQVKVVNQKFSIDLPIKNLWKKSKNIDVNVSVRTNNIKLNKSKLKFSKLNSSEEKNIRIQGQVIDANKDSRVAFNVSISYQDFSGKTYTQDFQLLTELYIDLASKATVMPIVMSKDVQDLLELFLEKNPELFDAGRTVIQRVKPTGITDEATEFYVSSPATKDGVEGINAYVLRQVGKRFIQKKAAFLPNGSRYQIFKYDLLPQNPGKEYIIRSDVDIVDEENNIIDKYLEFYILDNSLYNTLNVFRLKPRQSIEGRGHFKSLLNYYFDFTINGLINPNLESFYRDTQKLYSSMASHPRVLVNQLGNFNDLFFMAEGFISDLDNNMSINNFSQQDYISLQIYYMERIGSSNDLQLRTFSTPELKQQVKEQFADYFYQQGLISSKVLHPDMQLYLWKFLESNGDNSEVNVLASFSKEAQVAREGSVQKVTGINTNHFFIINIFRDTNGNMDFKVVPFDHGKGTGLSFSNDGDSRIDDRDDILTYFALDEMARGTLLGLKNSSFRSAENTYIGLGRSRFSSENTVSVKTKDPDEFLLKNGNLISYKNGEVYFSLFRTSGELLLTTEQGETVSYSSQEMKVTQFLPGLNFEEVIVPSYFNSSSGLTPAIFVNASEIYSRRVYSWVVDGDKKTLVSPINLNVELPENCYTLLPSKILNSASMHYTFLCKNKKNWEYRYVPMEVN